MSFPSQAPDGSEHGDDAFDPLLWGETTFLLTGEYRLRKRALLRGEAGGLVALSPGEEELQVFGARGWDPFDRAAKQHTELEKFSFEDLKFCKSCHADAGIHSVQSRKRLVTPDADQRDIEALGPEYGAVCWETQDTMAWKQRHYVWGLLNGYWQAALGR